MKLNNGLNIGVLRKRHCEICNKITDQEILFERKNLIAHCLECGQEVILSKEEANDQ